MSVTTHGVKGYDYQYRLTVLFGLLQDPSGDEKLFAEMVGSEDITFIDMENNILEIQTKMERSDLDLSLLAEWLFHFKEHDDTECLLTRITSGKCKCVFITRSRCSDDTRLFLNDYPEIKTNRNEPPLKILKAFRVAISNVSFKNTKLGNKRKQRADKIATELTDEEIIGLIKNTVIWEQIDSEKIDSEVIRILNKRFLVAESQCEATYLKLLKLVEQGRDNKNDLVAPFKLIVNALQINFFPIHSFHIARSQENKIYELLKSGNLVFLTGISQCGKTQLAMKCANEFISQGFNKLRSVSLHSVENFFNQNPSESKIALLEDPFGHIKPNEETAELKRKILDLSKSLPAHHKIIVTSRVEIINEVFSLSFFDHLPVVNITEDDADEILNFWNKFSLEYYVDQEIDELMRPYLRDEKNDKLQIGQLEYLAKYERQALKGKSLSELLSIARHNSVDVADDLAAENRERANILGVLSICCSNVIAVNKIDLIFILSKDKNEYTVFSEDIRILILRSSTKYPEYKDGLKISKKVSSFLVYFEERGFISKLGDMIIFSHPNYFEAGRILFFRRSKEEQIKNLNYLKKAIVSINPTTALFACKELYLIYKKTDQRFKQMVREFMLVANRSIYPSVEDYASVNLINILEDFEKEEERERIISIIDRGSTSSGSVKWHENQIPYIDKGGRSLSDLEKIPDSSVIAEISGKIDKGEYLNTKEAWDYVNFYKWKSFSRQIFKIESEVINALLAYDEVFIRKQAAKIFFCAEIEKKEIYLIDKIFSDIHPTVVFSGVWGAFLFWNKQDKEIKQYIFEFFKKLFARQEIAIRSKDLLLNFSIDYAGECIDWESFSEDEKIELWNVWGEIFPIFSKNLPAAVHINSGRFGDTMATAAKYLNHDNGIVLFKAWLDLIDYKIQNGVYVSDYEMGVVDELIAFTKDDHTARKEIFSKIFTHGSSFFLLYSLKILLPCYEKLHLEEKDFIIQLVEGDRKDIGWIHALLFAVYDIPESLLLIVTQGQNISNLKPTEIFKVIPSKLIYDSLKIIYGNPYELGLLRSNNLNDFWKKNINYILFCQIDPFFKLCIEDFVGTNIYASRSSNFLLWRKICLNTHELDYLLYLVIYNISTSTITFDSTRQIVTNIKTAYQRKGRLNDFTKIFADNIEALQLRHKEDIFRYFDKDYIVSQLYPALFPDFLVLEVMDAVGLIGIDPIIDKIDSFRFFYTYAVLAKEVAKDKFLNEEVKSRIIAIPDKISERGKIKQNEIEQKYLQGKIEIDNWSFK